MIRGGYIFLLLFLSTVNLFAQTNTAEPYDFPTKLKGGYNLVFKADSDSQYLYLTNKSKTIAEIASTDKGALYKSLGYIAADFNNYFVLAHSYGSGNPTSIALIKKTTGKNILNSSACWIAAIEKQGILLYCNTDVPSEKDKMILYHIASGKMRSFKFPADIFSEPQILNRIEIISLTNKQLVIKYEVDGKAKQKAYQL
jgi:hypothetical protein